MVTPEDILKEHSKTVQQITEQLRHIVLSTIPELTEKAYPSWRGIEFRHSQSGYVCGIFPAQDYCLNTASNCLTSTMCCKVMESRPGILSSPGQQTFQLSQ